MYGIIFLAYISTYILFANRIQYTALLQISNDLKKAQHQDRKSLIILALKIRSLSKTGAGIIIEVFCL